MNESATCPLGLRPDSSWIPSGVRSTRPDPTRPVFVVAAACGVSIKACIRRQGCFGADSRALNAARNADLTPTATATMHALREIGGVR